MGDPTELFGPPRDFDFVKSVGLEILFYPGYARFDAQGFGRLIIEPRNACFPAGRNHAGTRSE